MSDPIVIVGAGPAGLNAAWTLQQAGIENVIVLEREREAGGLPRHCGHLGFGIFDFYRIWRGPDYASHLRDRLSSNTIRCNHTVLKLLPNGLLLVRDEQHTYELQAARVLLATGTREMSRSTQMTGGTRPFGVINTGTLQRYVYETGQIPCQKPIVIGSEWVAFSSLLTLRHAKIKPVALVEKSPQVLAPGLAAMVSNRLFDVPVWLNTSLEKIYGDERVEGVVLKDAQGKSFDVACDAVILSGQFVPEASLIKSSHLLIDAGTQGPVIDSYWRCSDACYFAAGNVLRQLEHSGVAAAEGVAAAKALLQDLRGQLPDERAYTSITVAAPLSYVYPQRLSHTRPKERHLLLRARATESVKGEWAWYADHQCLNTFRLNVQPCRRIQLPWPIGNWQNAKQLQLRWVKSL